MNLIESFNLVSSAARALQANGEQHDQIKEALGSIASVVQDKINLDDAEKQLLETIKQDEVKKQDGAKKLEDDGPGKTDKKK
jgi:hypothetical protein